MTANKCPMCSSIILGYYCAKCKCDIRDMKPSGGFMNMWDNIMKGDKDGD